MDSLKFLPTDEEIITQYLCKKMDDSSFSAAAICEADLRRLDPRDGVFKQGEKREWFFFCSRAIEQRINIATTYSGFWITTGKDTQIFKGETLVGMKRSMVYYRGRAPTITKTNWLMHEYSLERSYLSSLQNEWVICKVFLENKMEEISNHMAELKL
ncbi:PREDICTED: NAC domain-containing protein 92-like [Ipomoea nil]|uniref:NAC domain-containing protein 92-like n=1 Tax=Ipomoea nil TaxID=35883 RepID=UPI0009008A92|nr:PREDICTED: NAC domain-containing protein 92-like [Ipomoea nil]